MHRLVSIILPVYNDTRGFLSETLASIRAQTRTNWECLCVEDGSTDDAQETLATAIRGDRRFRMICQPNKGIGKSRNRGLDAMRGDAFMHMDHDDLLLPNTLDILLEAAETSGAPMVAGQRLRFTTRPERIPCVPGGVQLEGHALHRHLFGSPHGLPFPSWGKLYDRAQLGHLRFLPLRYGDDVYYTPLTRHRASSCYICDAVVYLWREGHASASNLRAYSPTWLRDYSASVLATARTFPSRRQREGLFRGVKWVGHRLFRCPGFRTPGQWSPEFRDAVRTCCDHLLRAMPPFPAHPLWRLRLWLTLHGHLRWVKPILPKK